MIQRLEVEGAVIVVGPDAAEVGEAVRDAAAHGERVSALIGSVEDPAFQQALDEMVEELYGLGDRIS
ncbi:MAG: hypothetical protein ACXVKA_11020 [Acidimicrobiia bacterium]